MYNVGNNFNRIEYLSFQENIYEIKGDGMNTNETKYFNEEELQYCDATSLPKWYLIKSLLIKIRRRFWGRYFDKNARMSWSVDNVVDASGPTYNIRNYLERQTIRSILSDLKTDKISSACEVGCGYGRIIMVLKEFADNVVGFEREPHLLRIAQSLLPDIVFHNCRSLDQISQAGKGPFDLVMTSTVLQHLTDDFCGKVIEELKKISPRGYVLLYEKTESISVTKEFSDGNKFISRARSVKTYEKMMGPYTLHKSKEMVLEPTYDNKAPGTCMLFKSPKS